MVSRQGGRAVPCADDQEDVDGRRRAYSLFEKDSSFSVTTVFFIIAFLASLIISSDQDDEKGWS